jgi:hypothetical protein
MGQARASTKKLPQPPESPKKVHKKRPPSSWKSLKVIEQLKEAGKEAHLKARNTKKCYKGHVQRGREWLAQHFSKSSVNGSEDSEQQPTPDSDDLDEKDPYADPIFPHAFDCSPNRRSDRALALFLTYKGFHQSLSKGTIEGVRAAFKDLWDNAYMSSLCFTVGNLT